MSDIEQFIVMAFVLLAIWRMGVAAAELLSQLPVPPDSWDAEITRSLESPEATPVCHHCFTPQEHDRWFCPVCGSATGPYNNVMPYINIFSAGEVARNGVYNRIEHSGFSLFSYLAFSVFEYTVFAPVYWWRFYQHWITPAPKEPLDLDDPRPE